MVPPELETSFTLTREDYWQFHWFYLRRSHHRWSMVLNFAVGTVLCAVILSRLGASLAVAAIAAPPLGALLLVALLRIERTRVMSVPWERGDVLGEHFLSVNAEGVVERTNNRHSLTRWSGILDIVANKKYFFLFVETNKAFIVPRRAFRSAAEGEAFLDAANAHWKAGQAEARATKVDRYGYPLGR